MTRIISVLFDMDGVLFDSELIHAHSWRQVLAGHGLEVDTPWFQPWVGVADTHLARHLHEERGIGESADALLTQKRAAFKQMVQTDLVAPPGLTSALSRLTAALGPGRLAVVTSSYRTTAEHMLRCTGIDSFFATVVCADDVTAHKPDPEPYRTAAARLGVEPQCCIVVEDSAPGIASGRAAGCRVLSIHSPHSPLAAPDPVSPAEQPGARFERTVDAIDWVVGEVAGAAGTS